MTSTGELWSRGKVLNGINSLCEHISTYVRVAVGRSSCWMCPLLLSNYMDKVVSKVNERKF